MDSELLDTKILSKILIENHSKILNQQNEQDKQQRDLKIEVYIQEAQINFNIKKLNLDFYKNLGQDVYIAELSSQITIMIVFHYDFPKSQPQIFATKQMSHRLIDPDTWQIKAKWNDSLIQMMKDIVNQFATQAPEDDYMIEHLMKNPDDQFQKQIKAIQTVEVRKLFTNCSPNQFQQNLQLDLTPFIMQLEEYKKICKLIVERAQQNNLIGESIQQIMSENAQLKLEVEAKLQHFTDIQFEGYPLDQFCQKLAKSFSDKELARVLEKKIQMLEQYREEKYENKINEEDEKKFEKDIKEYLGKRKEYQISIQKRQYCLRTLQNKYKN
ncbi:unnamed protein product [Paramecium primaurelia]|uniref:Uncharacterized protein n=1 Tax=Paramecium primaurelia TaxID=5886 RepID=A0A8S1N991_PARPR|nr:unnamed protein product [Paramecium primaurelia]